VRIMSEITELTKKTVNRLLEFIANSENIPTILPSEKKMAESIQVSRTTLLKALADVEKKNLVRQENGAVLVLKKPKKSDFYDQQNLTGTKSQIVENYILDCFTNNELKPGDRFSELQLAKKINANTVTVREVLLKISASGLISKNPRQKWEVISITAETIQQISDYRELLEFHGIKHLIKSETKIKRSIFCKDLLKRHKELLSGKEIPREKVIELENAFHKGIVAHTNNKFIQDHYDSLFLLINYHLRQRIMTAERFKEVLIEHIGVLNAIMNEDLEQAQKKLGDHFIASRNFFYTSNKL
jgi:GntR family transcriptional regulator, transcriptional activator for L-galactonate catabolism